MNLNLLWVLALTVSLRNVEVRAECSQALMEAVACQERAMATHKSEAVEPTVELGREWLDIEAKRNCRLITSLNTCGEDLAACPAMLRVWASMKLDAINKLTFWTNKEFDTMKKFQGTNVDWDTICPDAKAPNSKEEKLKPEAKEEELEPDSEEDDKIAGNKSSQINQISLLGCAL